MKIMPIEECLEYEEFTDRVELLRDLENWIKNIRFKRSSSSLIMKISKGPMFYQMGNMITR